MFQFTIISHIIVYITAHHEKGIWQNSLLTDSCLLSSMFPKEACPRVIKREGDTAGCLVPLLPTKVGSLGNGGAQEIG